MLITADGAPYLSATQVEEPNEKTPAYVPGISYLIADYGMANFAWSSLVGKSTLLILPEFDPRQDEAPFLSPKPFVQACVKVLEEGKTQGLVTNIFFGYMSKVAPPNPTLAPLLDRRVDFLKLNGWINEIMVLPMIKFSTRSRDLSLVSMTTPSTFPLILLHLTTTVPTGFAPPVKAFTMHSLGGGLMQECGAMPPPIPYTMYALIVPPSSLQMSTK